MWPADSPTELAQKRVADPEVMTPLVNERPPNLLDDFGIAVAHRADGMPVDRDPVRQGAGVERRPTRQWHPLVEPHEAGRATVVLHSGCTQATKDGSPSISTSASPNPTNDADTVGLDLVNDIDGTIFGAFSYGVSERRSFRWCDWKITSPRRSRAWAARRRPAKPV